MGGSKKLRTHDPMARHETRNSQLAIVGQKEKKKVVRHKSAQDPTNQDQPRSSQPDTMSMSSACQKMQREAQLGAQLRSSGLKYNQTRQTYRPCVESCRISVSKSETQFT